MKYKYVYFDTDILQHLWTCVSVCAVFILFFKYFLFIIINNKVYQLLVYYFYFLYYLIKNP